MIRVYIMCCCFNQEESILGLICSTGMFSLVPRLSPRDGNVPGTCSLLLYQQQRWERTRYSLTLVVSTAKMGTYPVLAHSCCINSKNGNVPGTCSLSLYQQQRWERTWYSFTLVVSTAKMGMMFSCARSWFNW